jgi:hypothetical protein
MSLSGQNPLLKQSFPLANCYQPPGKLLFANGSRILGIPGGEDQVRSYHPWGLLQDEAAFMPEAGSCYDHAVPACQKIVVVSSIGPGWFSGQCRAAIHASAVGLPRGVSLRRMLGGRPVVRIHYSADPDRDPALHPDWQQSERRKYCSQGTWDREQEIIYGIA